MQRKWSPWWLVLMAGCGQTVPNVDPCLERRPGDLIITEVMLDPDGADLGNEWFELYNTRGEAVDMRGLQLYVKKADGSGLKSHTVRAGSIPAAQYAAVGDVRGAMNPSWIAYTYGDDLGALLKVDGVIGVRCGSTVLDEITYRRPALSGRSRTFDGTLDAANNDDEARWCDTPTTGTSYSPRNFGTPGAPNSPCTPTGGGDTCLEGGSPRAVVEPTAGQLVITEVMADPRAVSDLTGEWFEVQAKAPVDLNGLVVTVGTSRTTVSSTDCLRLNTDQYGILVKSTDPQANGFLPRALSTFTATLTNDGGTVGLYLRDAGIVDVATVPRAIAGVALQLPPTMLTATANDNPASFCASTVRWNGGAADGGDFGTPAAANTACPDAGDLNTCVDPGTGLARPIVRPNPGDMVITEFMANPSGDDDLKEWFEVLAKSEFDLNGIVLASESNSNTLTFPTCSVTEPMSYLLFARNIDSTQNGGLPAPTATFSFGLANSAGTSPRAVIVRNQQNVELDRLTYSTSVDGASTQLNRGLSNPTDNDLATNLCTTPAGITYGNDGGTLGDRGTPRGENAVCP